MICSYSVGIFENFQEKILFLLAICFEMRYSLDIKCFDNQTIMDGAQKWNLI